MRSLITLLVSLTGFLIIGCGTPSFLITPVASTNALEEQTVVGGRGFFPPKIAIIEVEGMLAKIGGRAWAITIGPLKEMGSPFKPLAAPEREVMQQMVNQYFERFVGVVRSNRTINEAPAANVTDYKDPTYSGVFSGRVFSG